MEPGCERMSAERLAAWLDGAASEAEREVVAAHIAGCPACREQVESLRALEARLARFGAAATPATLPAGLWERVRAGLDRADTAVPVPGDGRAGTRPVESGGRPGRPLGQRQRQGLRRLSLRTARYPQQWVLLAGLLVLLAAAAALHFRARPPLPAGALLGCQLAAPAVLLAEAPGTVTLRTADADRAARWLGEQLGARIPAVNLSLAGARLAGAAARSAARQGTLWFVNPQGVPLSLDLFLAGPALPPLRAVEFRGSRYVVLERAASRRSVIAWRFEGRSYSAAAPLPVAELLPYAREMDRHCRRR